MRAWWHLSEALVRRRGTGGDGWGVEVAAACCTAAVSVAVERWATRGGVPTLVDEAFAAVGELVSMPGDDVAVIRVSGLTKRYGDLSAVDDVGLEVNAGEVYALVGLNGAGKTTLIRMLGMVRPSSGSVSVAGRPVTGRCGRTWGIWWRPRRHTRT